MATKIVTKNSSTASAVPTASDLVQGELAVNVADKRLFTEDNAGAIVELGTNPSGNVTFQDNGKAIFGAGSDLQIYHDGSHSYVGDYGTGNLSVTGNNLYLQNTSGETYLSGISDGAVSLYHNNAEKLATTSTGIDVTGNLTMASGGSIVAGGANDLILNAGESGTPDIYLQSGSSTKVKIEGSNGNVGIGTSSPSSFNYLSTSPHLVIGGGSSDAGVTCYSSTNGYGRLAFADGTNTTEQYRGLIQFYHGDNSMQFYTGSDERMRIDSSGNVGIGTSSPDSKLDVSRGSSGEIARFTSPNGTASYITIGRDSSTSEGFTAGYNSSNGDCTLTALAASHPIIFKQSTTERMRIDSSGNLLVGKTSDSNTANGVTLRADGGARFTAAGTSTFYQLAFFRNGSASEIGSITTTSSATAYNTSSDYRLKENVVELTGATERLKQLNPLRFNFIVDADTTVDGFLAHEVQDVVPEAITGTKDAVDADGNPDYQGIDQSKLVPLLVATIQELEARITQLENN